MTEILLRIIPHQETLAEVVGEMQDLMDRGVESHLGNWRGRHVLEVD